MVLGAILNSPDCLMTVAEVVTPDDFYTQAHRLIYSAILDMSDKRRTIELPMLRDHLDGSGELERIGGVVYLMELAEGCPSSSVAPEYAQVVKDSSTARGLIVCCRNILQDAYTRGKPVEGMLNEAQAALYRLGVAHDTNGDIQPASFWLPALMERIERYGKSESSTLGISTGLLDVDQYTQGFKAGEMTIIAGRTSQGKTTLALNFVVEAAIERKIPTLLFSLEVMPVAAIEALAVMRGKISSSDMRRGRLSQDDMGQLNVAISELSEDRIVLAQTPRLNPRDMRTRTIRSKERFGTSLVVIDYVQRMYGGGKFENRQREVAWISGQIKELALELEIPIIAICQLNRAPTQRTDGAPRISDIRESGVLEQDADVVLLINRPGFPDGDDKNETFLTIAKNRNGDTGRVQLWFDADRLKFHMASREER